jgi:hypothetical protein
MQTCNIDRPIDALNGRGEPLPEAPRCHSRLSCVLNGRCGDQPLCTVEFAISSEMVFVTEGSCECRYHFQFGGGHVCNCPVRVALHRLRQQGAAGMQACAA